MAFFQKLLREDRIIPPKLNAQVGFYLLIIVAAALKQLQGVQHHLDIPFFDETEYLLKGFNLGAHAFNDWGPSYNLWYFLLSKICPDPVQLFYINYSLMIVLIPALLFLFLMVYGIEKNISLLLTLSFLMQPLMTSNFTFVSHFCLLNILLAFFAMAFINKNESKILLVMIASYICMYARQEFLVIFGTLLLIWLILLVYQKKLRSAVYIPFVAVITGLYMIFGFISFRAQGIDRSLFAFKQHFYTNYIFWTKKVLTTDQFDALDIFHGSKTMFQCMIANPGMFAKHVATNMLNYLINAYKYTENFILPSPVFRYLGKGKHILFVAFLVYLFYLLFKQKAYRNVSAFVRENNFTCILIFVFFAWSFFSIFFIFPERHYIILQFCWWIFLMALLFKNNIEWIEKPILFFPIVVALLIFTPTARSVEYYHNMVKDARQQPNLKVINYLRKNNSHRPTVLFTTERGFNAYLPANYRELFLEQDDIRPYIINGDIDIQQFFIDKNVDAIYMNEKLQNLVRQTLKRQGNVLLNDPMQLDFHKVVIDSSMTAYLLLRNI